MDNHSMPKSEAQLDLVAYSAGTDRVIVQAASGPAIAFLKSTGHDLIDQTTAIIPDGTFLDLMAMADELGLRSLTLA